MCKNYNYIDEKIKFKKLLKLYLYFFKHFTKCYSYVNVIK